MSAAKKICVVGTKQGCQCTLKRNGLDFTWPVDIRRRGRGCSDPPGFSNLAFSHHVFSKKGWFRSFEWV